jgi:hypothetical protein
LWWQMLYIAHTLSAANPKRSTSTGFIFTPQASYLRNHLHESGNSLLHSFSGFTRRTGLKGIENVYHLFVSDEPGPTMFVPCLYEFHSRSNNGKGLCFVWRPAFPKHRILKEGSSVSFILYTVLLWHMVLI